MDGSHSEPTELCGYHCAEESGKHSGLHAGRSGPNGECFQVVEVEVIWGRFADAHIEEMEDAKEKIK